ncbi:TPA: DUF4352 domain-containing protein [Streptococcus suis]|nr:DUF4352 domain-containing protein [Streptococcus suis]
MDVKDFVVENGQMYYKKKPFFKQPLFWTSIVGLVLSFVLGITCLFLMTSLSLSDTSDSWSSESYFDDTVTYTEHQVGERVVFPDGLQITVTAMGTDDSLAPIGDNGFAYLVELDVKNTSAEPLYFDEYMFQLIDVETYIPYDLDMRTYDVNLPEKINPGEAVKIKLIYEVNQASNLGLVYEGAVWTEFLTEGI